MPVKTLKTRMPMKMETFKARIYYPAIIFFYCILEHPVK